MDSLRPDRDDLDLYNSRKNKNKSAKAALGKSGEKAKGVNASRPVSPGASAQLTGSNEKAKSSGGSPLMIVLLLLMILALAGLSYLYWQQSQTVTGLEKRLTDADEFIGQSKLLFARLEGEVTETGAELLQTGTSAEKKMAFLESEVRKLWAVAYDRNRKTIQAHEKSIETLGKKIADSQKTIAAQKASLSALKAESKKGLAVLDGRVASMSGELSITRAEQEESLKLLEQKLTSIGSSNEALEKRIESVQLSVSESTKVQLENQQSLSSIDDSRRQLIKRVIDLEGRLSKLSASGVGAELR